MAVNFASLLTTNTVMAGRANVEAERVKSKMSCAGLRLTEVICTVAEPNCAH